MPLKVTVQMTNADESVSSRIGTLYIARLERLDSFTQTSNYVVGATMESVQTQEDVAWYTHTYSDGYETCVRKAIEAREKAGISR